MKTFKNTLKKTILPLMVNINFLFGQYYYELVSATNPDNDRYIEKINQVNIYTGDRETLINIAALGLHSYRPDIHNSGTKVFLDSWDEGLFMVDVEDPTQIINLSRLLGDPAMALHCPLYHAETEKLYLAWQKWDGPEHGEQIDPNTGETIRTFTPVFNICSATFSEDGQRIYSGEIPTDADRENMNFHFLIINANTLDIIERIPFSYFGEGPNVMIGGNYENQFLITNVTDTERFTYLINIDTKERSKRIELKNSQMALSLDGKYVIQALRSPEFDYNHNGEVWIHEVIWPDDGGTISIEDGMYMKFPVRNLGYRTYPLKIIENAPEVFSYRLEHDEYLVRLKDAKIIRVNQRPIAQTFSVFATNSIWLKDSVQVKSGYVGVNNTTTGPYLDSDVQLSIDDYTNINEAEEIFANSIKIETNANVNGNVYTNSLINNGNINGTINNPFPFPVLGELPLFKDATTDTINIIVEEDEIITLDPGNYGDLFVNTGGKVVLSGGIYNFKSIELRRAAKLRFASASEVRLSGKLYTKSEVIIGPRTNAEITPSDIVFYIAGINGDTGELEAEPKAARIGTKSSVKANIYVPNGTLHIKSDCIAKGAFFAKDVKIGQRVVIKLYSAWELEF